jgi:secreted Zn-dependent insulinase-like peptidase
MSNQAQYPRPASSLLTGQLDSQLDTPRDDSRLYKHLTLPNQLEVLLVHDVSTDKASAANGW